MSKVDQIKLEKSLIYLKRISQGRHPVNNKPLDEDDTLRDPNVVRCMKFIEEVMEELNTNGRVATRKISYSKRGKLPFPYESVQDFSYQEDKSISKLTRQINELIDSNKYLVLSSSKINAGLIALGYLENKNVESDGRCFKLPTEKGIEIGMYSVERQSEQYGHGYITLYNETAQKFIVKNLSKIMSNSVKDSNQNPE